MDFFGYETCDKFIWTSGEGYRNKNKIIKQGIPKINIKKISFINIGFWLLPT